MHIPFLGILFPGADKQADRVQISDHHMSGDRRKLTASAPSLDPLNSYSGD
jgi:hypothetical protein